MARGIRRTRSESRHQRRTRATRHVDTTTRLQPLVAHCWRCGTVLISGQTQLVRRDEQVSREDACRELDHRLASGAHSRRPLRQLAGQQCRLGAVARPLLGTPLPIWRCPDDHFTCVGSLAELSALAGRDLGGPRPARRRSARSARSTRCSCRVERARKRPAVSSRSSTPGSTPGRWPRGQVGYPPRRGQRRGDAVPGAAHRRGDRSDARLVLHPARGQHPGLCAKPFEHVLCLGHIVDENGKENE